MKFHGLNYPRLFRLIWLHLLLSCLSAHCILPRMITTRSSYQPLIDISSTKIRKSKWNARPFSALTLVRGGSSVLNTPSADQSTQPFDSDQNVRRRDIGVGNLTAVVTSNFGMSSFLRKSQKFMIRRNSTVLQLKSMIQDKFTGCPPIALQNLYLNNRLLKDDEIWGEISNKLLVSVQLDLLTGTQQYNRTFQTLSDNIDAQISLMVHEAYLYNKMTEILTSDGSGMRGDASSRSQDSVKYRLLYKKLNSSFYEELADEIKNAMESERDPLLTSTSPHEEIPSKLGVAKRNEHTFTTAIKKSLILNDRSFSKLKFWSLALMVTLLVLFHLLH